MWRRICGIVFMAILVVYVNRSYGCGPQAILTVDANVLRGVSVTLDASYSTDTSPGVIVKYEWDFDYDGSTFTCHYYETSTSCPDGVFDGNAIGGHANYDTLDDGLRMFRNRPLGPAGKYADPGDTVLAILATDICGYGHRTDAPNTANTGLGDLGIIDLRAYEYFTLMISGGNQHLFALDRNGFVWAWGNNRYAQFGNGESGAGEANDIQMTIHKDASNVLTDIVHVNAGFYHSLAIDKYGQRWVWGRNQESQHGLVKTAKCSNLKSLRHD
ncbi:MAG: hypothetical protein ACYTEL_26350 [Planctomycetota bacterium]|jgi:hypothetical protein